MTIDRPCPDCQYKRTVRPMRLTSEFSVVRECGATVEWPDTQQQTTCARCQRVIVVPTWSGA